MMLIFILCNGYKISVRKLLPLPEDKILPTGVYYLFSCSFQDFHQNRPVQMMDLVGRTLSLHV